MWYVLLISVFVIVNTDTIRVLMLRQEDLSSVMTGSCISIQPVLSHNPPTKVHTTISSRNQSSQKC